MRMLYLRRVRQKSCDDLIDRRRRRIARGRALSPAHQPFRDQRVVSLAAFNALEPTEVMIFAIDRHHRLTATLVQSIAWLLERTRWTCHDRSHVFPVHTEITR